MTRGGEPRRRRGARVPVEGARLQPRGPRHQRPAHRLGRRDARQARRAGAGQRHQPVRRDPRRGAGAARRARRAASSRCTSRRPVEVCSERDVKGLYAKQRAGELTGPDRGRRAVRGADRARRAHPDARADARAVGRPAARRARRAGARMTTADRPVAARRARGREHPRDARGRRRVRAPGAAVQRRQGLDRHAAPGAEGVLAGQDPVPARARRHRPQLPRGAGVPRPPGRRAGRAPGRREGAGRHRRRPRPRGARAACATRCRP